MLKIISFKLLFKKCNHSYKLLIIISSTFIKINIIDKIILIKYIINKYYFIYLLYIPTLKITLFNKY